MDSISNVRKGSAPPALNTRANGNVISPGGIPSNSAKSHADTVRTHISDNIYQDRVNSLTAKTNKLINRHKTAQQVK
jgi:hypothetical protein